MNNKTTICLGVILTAFALLFFAGYFLRSQKLTPVDVSLYDISEAGNVEREVLNATVDTAELHEKNLFHPMRGEVAAIAQDKPEQATPQAQGSFELTGIFQYQGVKGALVITQSNPDTKEPKPRRMYKAGDSIGNGYNIVEISDEQVIIGRGTERITLPLKKKRGN